MPKTAETVDLPATYTPFKDLAPDQQVEAARRLIYGIEAEIARELQQVLLDPERTDEEKNQYWEEACEHLTVLHGLKPETLRRITRDKNAFAKERIWRNIQRAIAQEER